jgi:hypothetical protein
VTVDPLAAELLRLGTHVSRLERRQRSSGGGGGGVSDHGALTGLGDDDHPQYLRPAEVLPGAGVAVLYNPDGTVLLSVDLATFPGGDPLTEAEADARYVNVTGDTITGPIVHAATPAANAQTQLVNKGYVDSEIIGHESDPDPHPNYLTPADGDALYVNISGDTMTGLLTVSGPPTAALHAASKGYVDGRKLDDLFDVNAPAPTDTQVLTWNTSSGSWVPAARQEVNLNPLVLPDLAGVAYPALRWGSGDGQNGSLPNPYAYEWNLLNDELRLFSLRQPSVALAVFSRPAADVARLKLQDWTISRDSDGYLRFYAGAFSGTGDNDFTIGNGGNIWAAGSANISTNVTTNQTLVNYRDSGGALWIRSPTYAEIQANGAIGAPGVGFSLGNQYGVGVGPTASLFAYPNGNQYYQRIQTFNKIGGAGEVGIGLVNHVTGWTSAFQMHNDGAIYIGCLNGANTAYVKSYAAAFTVISTARFKAERTPLLGALARRLVDRVAPVRYRDLQHEMALDAASTAPFPPVTSGVPGRPRPAPEVMPRFRFGLVAEEVEVEAGELIDSSPHGPGLDLSGLIGVLWAAVRDLSADLTDARTRLAALEGSA